MSNVSNEWKSGVKVSIPGGEYIVPNGDTSFVAGVKEAARHAGLETFRVFVNGEEVTGPQDAPSTIGGAEGSIEVQPMEYDRAG